MNHNIATDMDSTMTTPIGSAYQTRGRNFPERNVNVVLQPGNDGDQEGSRVIINKGSPNTGLTEQQVID